MLGYEDLTVGTIAGLIAAGVFVIQFLLPPLLTLILIGFLRQEDTAATWSVVGRTLHASHWPVLLRSDTAGVQGVRGTVKIIITFQIFLVLLVSIASIVTPLGLYETIAPQDNLQEELFHYVKDNTSLGLGTLARRNDLGLSRYCSNLEPAACLWSNTTIIKTPEQNSSYDEWNIPGGFDMRLPKNLTEIFSAGLSRLDKTVSSAFDIQWRTFKKVPREPDDQGGQPYLVGSYRYLSQVILNDAWEAFEGLVVDTKIGGMGFRNHTIPISSLPYGATWSEDLLFIEPETECVDKNITVDFRIPTSEIGDDQAQNLTIVDHGGFVNLDRQTPWYDANKTWENASLRDRAYFAAWWGNIYAMYYLNITNPKGHGYADRFHYLNSTLGANFQVDTGDDVDIRYDQWKLDYAHGSFLGMHRPNGTGVNGSIYANPYKIDYRNFSNIADACVNDWQSPRANISNIAVMCGMLYGTPKRHDGSVSLEFEPGTEWTTPLYSCASAFRASVKTVTFAYNRTGGLKALSILDVQPKAYANEEEIPLWAVENLQLRLTGTKPLWGITLPEHGNHPNISTTRQPHLYLPGLVEPVMAKPFNDQQNLAGVDFYVGAMDTLYNLNTDNTVGYRLPDYTGRTNLALFTKWQQLSANSSTAASVINLLWTDISANAVVGARGQLPPEPLQNLAKRTADSQTSTVTVPITVYARNIRFRLRYGIPAFIALALLALIASIALSLLVIGHATLSKLRRYLDQTSAGRIYTMFLYPNDHQPDCKRSEWVQAVGKKRVNVGGSSPCAVDATTAPKS